MANKVLNPNSDNANLPNTKRPVRLFGVFTDTSVVLFEMDVALPLEVSNSDTATYVPVDSL